MTNEKLANWLKRPEVLTLLIALVVSGASYAKAQAVPVPEKEIGLVVSVFWLIFVGACFEGKFKGAEYVGGLTQLLNSRKFRLGVVMLLGVIINALLKPLGYELPADTILSIGNFVLLAIGGMAGIDGAQASDGG